MSNQQPYPAYNPGPGTIEDPAPKQRNGIRVGTVVWGLVFVVLGVWLLATSLGLPLDTDLWIIALSCGAGIALIAGSIGGMLRNRNRNN